MRIAVVLVVTCLLSACGAQFPSGPQAFLEDGDGARAARAELDAQAILDGMAQARTADERVARALDHASPGAEPQPVTR